MRKQFLLLLVFIIFLGGCSKEDSGLQNPDPDFIMDATQIERYNDYALNSFRYLADSEDNVLFSPMSLYFALSILAEGCEGDSRQEILNALNLSAEELTAMNYQLLANLPFQEAENAFLIKNSLWVNINIPFNPDYQDYLENYYDAQVYLEEINTDTNKKASAWVKENTRDLIDTDIELSSIITIINTIYFKDAWQEPFSAENNYEDDFYQADGTTVKVTYMQQLLSPKSVYQNEEYSKVELAFENSFSLMFVLPAENNDVQSLLESRTFLSADILNADVNLHLPKFTQKSGKLDLREMLHSMGINSVLDPDLADFGMMTTEKVEDLYVDKVIQEAYLAIDEKGGEAAAYTEIGIETMAAPMDKIIEIKFDKPFIYLLLGPNGEIIFIGIAQYPE